MGDWKMRKSKKPFYKVVWFWLFLVMIAVSGILFVTLGDQMTETEYYKSRLETKETTETTTTETTSSSSSSKKTNKKHEALGLGEEYILAKNGTEKMYSITIDEVGQNWNQFATEQMDYEEGAFKGLDKNKILQIKYTYKNYGLEEPFLANSQYLTVYDQNGKAGQLTNAQDGQNEVTEGKSSDSTVWAVMPENVSDITKVSVEFKDTIVGGESFFEIPM